jgi:glycosyltransferase involved in cell wall biosynthesis
MGIIGGSMKKKIILKGPVLTRSGYGEQARFALRSLMSRQDLYDIYIQPLQWGRTSWISEQTEERLFIDSCIKKTVDYIQQGGSFDMSLQVTIPNEFEKMATVDIGYTAGIETTVVSAEWLQKINEIVNSVIVVSSFSTHAFKNTTYSGELNGQPATLKLDKPIDFVNYAVKDYDHVEPLNLNLKNDVNFLCVAQWGPRKNMDATLNWFVEEFHNEDVGLVIKTNITKNSIMDRTAIFERLKSQLSAKYPDMKCKIYLLHGDMSEEEMHALYKDPKINACISFAHGEGFGLPLFEAAYSGLPIVCTGWSGQLDFLVDENKKERFYNVSYDIRKVPEHVLWENVVVADAMWSFPREQSAKQQMRQCYNDIVSKNKMDATAYVSELKERFSKEKMYEKFVSLVEEQAPENLAANNMDEIEKLFAEAL